MRPNREMQGERTLKLSYVRLFGNAHCMHKRGPPPLESDE